MSQLSEWFEPCDRIQQGEFKLASTGHKYRECCHDEEFEQKRDVMMCSETKAAKIHKQRNT